MSKLKDENIKLKEQVKKMVTSIYRYAEEAYIHTESGRLWFREATAEDTLTDVHLVVHLAKLSDNKAAWLDKVAKLNIA